MERLPRRGQREQARKRVAPHGPWDDRIAFIDGGYFARRPEAAVKALEDGRPVYLDDGCATR
ncbi:hypothetical protein [Streptomyces californicus]|uniref:hypothetical protein n=1 Tax=Streptomyces californicus TaxID=67351 RepID=UPI00371C0F15